MSSVDTRVVQMQFDNKQFERDMSTTMSSLKKLENSLKFDGASKGLEELNEASSKSASSFKNVENLACQAGFNIRDVWLKMATVFEYQIAGRLVNAAKGIISAFTIDPVKTGLAEYETQINSVQTILANTSSKGTTLDQVNTALDTLNAYADKTIYNFTEMTKNIGTFTAAGVDLDTSVSAIQGIANLAAISGSTSQQASTAMYQLSQALSSGTVKLMDWNSVTNAGMGGQVFQDALKETARVYGINIDEMIEKEGSFRETLKNGWLSSEILTETLKKFTYSKEDMTEAQIAETEAMLKAQGYTEKQIEAIFELGKTSTNAATKVKTFTQLMDTLKEAAQSGWTQSWEILVGDFEEAKELWTNISDVVGTFINNMSNARNEMLQTWKDLGGRTALLEALKNIFAGLANIIKPIAKAFREVFPPTTGDQLYNITIGFKELTERFKAWTENEDNLKSITTIFKGMFSVLKVGIKLFGAAAKVAGALFVTGAKLAGMLVKMVAPLFKFGDGLLQAVEAGNVFDFIAEKIVDTVSTLYTGIKSIVVSIGKSFGLFKEVDVSGLDEFLDALKRRFAPIIKLGEGLWRVVTTVWNTIKKVTSLIVKVIKDMSRGIADAIESGNYDYILNIMDTALLGGIAAYLIEFFKEVMSWLKNSVDLKKNINDILEGISDSFEAFQRSLNAKAIMRIAGAIAILVASLIALSFLDMDDIGDGLTILAVVMTMMFAGLALVAKASNGGGGNKYKINITSLNKMGGALVGLGLAVLAIAGALRMLAGLSWDDIWPAFVAIGTFTVLLGTFMVVMSKVGKTTTTLSKAGLNIQRSGFAGAALTLIAFAGAIWILSDALLRFQGLSWQDIDQGVYVLAGMMAAMTGVAVVLSKFASGNTTKSAITIIAFAGATWILASALKALGDLDTDVLLQGGIALAAMMGILAVTTSGSGMEKGALSILAFAAAIWILVPAIQTLGTMDMSKLAQGVIAISVAMLAFAGAMRLMPKDGGMARVAGFLALAAAILAIAYATKTMAEIPLNGLIQAGVVLGGLLVVMGTVAVVAKKSVVGAAAIAIIGASVLMMAGALLVLSSIPWDQLGKGVFALITTLGTFSVVAMLMAAMGPVILAGAGAMALVGAALLLTATSALVFVSALAALTPALKSLATLSFAEVASSLLTIVAVFGAFVIAMTPLSPLMLIVGAALLVLSAGLAAAGAAMTVFGTGLNVVVVAITALIHLIKSLVSDIDGVFEKMRERFKAFKDSIPSEFIQMGKNIIAGLIKGLGDAAKSLWESIKGIGKQILTSIKRILGIHSPSKEMATIGKFTIQGFIDGFKSKVSNILTYIKNFASKCITTVKNGLVSFGNTAKTAVSNFNSGFKSKVSSAISTAKTFASNIASSIKTGVSNLASTGRTAISNFASGISSKTSSALSTVKNVASKCVTNVKNGISGFATAGKNAVSGFINGLKSKLSAAANTAWDVGKRALSSIKNALGIHSPSKEFEEVGMYSDEGLAGGLKKFAGIVGKSAANVGKTAVESLTTPMSHISDILNSDMNDDLTIRPVLDLSQVQDDASQLGGMFGQQTVALAGVNAGLMNGNTRTLADIAAQMQRVNDAGNSDIVDAITGLRNDFNNLSEAVSRMKVVMDTGTLVGEITPGVDSGLGIRALHKGRGN